MPVEILIDQDSILKDDEGEVGHYGYFNGELERTMGAVSNTGLPETRFWPDHLRETVFMMTEYMLYHAQQACRAHLPSDRFWGVYVIGSGQERPPRLVDLDLLTVTNMGECGYFVMPLTELGLYPLANFDLEDELFGQEMPEQYHVGEVDRASLFKYVAVQPNSNSDFKDLNIKAIDFAEEDEAVVSRLDEFEAGLDIDAAGQPLSRLPLVKLRIEKVTAEKMERDRFYS